MAPFDMSATDLAVVLTRGAFVACLLSSLGTALFLRVITPPIWSRLPDGRSPVRGQCHTLLRLSLIAACLTGLAWLVLQAADITDAETTMQALTAVPAVLLDTRFGQFLTAQIVLVLAALAASRRQNGDLAVLSLAGAATLLEAGHGHAFAMSPRPNALLACDALHVLAAGAWLGGLLPLLIVVRDVPLDVAALAARRFSILGIAAVATLAATALFQGWVLSGGLSGLAGTAYGTVLLLKGGLFAMLLGLAALNRLRFTPGLAGPGGAASRRALLYSIALETFLGLCAVLAAGLLSGLEPGMHHHGG